MRELTLSPNRPSLSISSDCLHLDDNHPHRQIAALPFTPIADGVYRFAESIICLGATAELFINLNTQTSSIAFADYAHLRHNVAEADVAQRFLAAHPDRHSTLRGASVLECTAAEAVRWSVRFVYDAKQAFVRMDIAFGW